MVIKEADIRTGDIETLNQLLLRPDLLTNTRHKIEQQLKFIYSGIKGEKQSAYQLQFHFGQSDDWVVIHDLRLPFQGRIAQIDHVLINRKLQVFVCESKRVAGEISINEQGEFSQLYNGKTQGMSSPLEQNQRHISILKNIFKSSLVALPTRLGIRLQPTLYSLILVSSEAHIRRPKVNIAGIDCIIKNDQLKTKVAELSNSNNLFHLIKKVSSETLKDIAYQLVKLHSPIQKDWYAYFGLSDYADILKVQIPAKPANKIEIKHKTKTIDNYQSEVTEEKHFCITCCKNISLIVAQYCWNNKKIFKGKAYCYQCQQKIKQ
jgi:hypothetical protein